MVIGEMHKFKGHFKYKERIDNSNFGNRLKATLTEKKDKEMFNIDEKEENYENAMKALQEEWEIEMDLAYNNKKDYKLEHPGLEEYLNELRASSRYITGEELEKIAEAAALRFGCSKKEARS